MTEIYCQVFNVMPKCYEHVNLLIWLFFFKIYLFAGLCKIQAEKNGTDYLPTNFSMCLKNNSIKSASEFRIRSRLQISSFKLV